MRSDAMMPDVTLHPLNRSFTWQPPAPPYRRISDEQARAYDELGYFVLDGAFELDLLASLEAEIDPLEAELEAVIREADGGRVFIARADKLTFTANLVLRSGLLRSFVQHPVLVDLCADLIGPDARFYWDQAVYKKPAPDATFPWHQDNGYAYIEPQQYLTCWIPLTDATERNGCPIVVPGVHRLGTLEHRLGENGFVCLEDPPGAVAVEAERGSIIVFSSLTPHCTLPNLTDKVRKAYIVQYAVDPSTIVRTHEGGREEVPVDDPDRQFRVLRDGRPVPLPA